MAERNGWNKFWDDAFSWAKNGLTDAGNFINSILPSGIQNQNNIEFQQNENEIIRQREDTAYSRAATDLANAGLSKTLAAGSPAPTAATSAPKESFSASGDIQNILGAVELSDELKNNAVARDKTKAELDLIGAQADYYRKQAENVGVTGALNQLDLDYYTKFNLSPAQNNKYLQLLNGIISEVKGLFFKDGNGGNWVEPVAAKSVPYTSNSTSGGTKPHLDMSDSSNLMPALAAPSYDTEFRESYPIENRMVPRDEATGASYDRGMADNDTLELNWMAVGPAVMDAMMSLPSSFTEHLHYDEDSCHMYLDNGDYESLAPKMFGDLRDKLMIANGWNEPVAETMIKYALIYGVKHRMW